MTILRYTYARPLTLLFATSALVLLIAAANLANLLLARTDPGQVAIQTALGASVGRLVRQSLSEGLLLSGLGATLGLVVATLCHASSRRAHVCRARETLPLDLQPSPVVLAFAFGLALLTGVLFSAAPAWATARSNPIDALRGAGRGGEQRSFVPRRSLVIAQVALSVVLLAGAGLLTESLQQAGTADRSASSPMDASVARVRPTAPTADLERHRGHLRPPAHAPAPDSRRGERHPFPLQSDGGQQLVVGHQPRGPAVGHAARQLVLEPHRSRLLRDDGTRLLRGRTIDERDALNAPRVAVVNEAFVGRFFPNHGSDRPPAGHRRARSAPATSRSSASAKT